MIIIFKGKSKTFLKTLEQVKTNLENGNFDSAIALYTKLRSKFKKLKKDKEKEEFIALFWAKRDPTPYTEKNEFKEAFYANLEFVNTKYTRGQEMGWKTIIGKILLFFGMPAERQTNPETWIYDPIPTLKIATSFKIVFDAVEGVGLVLNQNR